MRPEEGEKGEPGTAFRTDPWSRALELVAADRIGPVKLIGVQEVCAPGRLDDTVREWQTRLEALLGSAVRCDTVDSGSARSIILRYEPSALGRIFVDTGPGERFVSFEVVGADGLILWKPQIHAVSCLFTAGGGEASGRHSDAGSDCEGGQR